jgi:hypothetical protein
MTRRAPVALLFLLAIAGCRGAVAAKGMSALGPWADREIALGDAQPGEDELVSSARVGARDGLAKAGLAFTSGPRPDALEIRVRLLRGDEGRSTILDPKGFVADRAPMVVGGAANVVSHVTEGKVRGAAQNVEGAALAVGLVRESIRVRLALELFAPGEERPLGGVAWEGYRRLSAKGEAEKAGVEAGEALAHEIASQRDRWVDRRAASERLFLTSTPLLLEPGEAVLSLEEGLLLHGGYGVTPWLQLDLAAGGVVAATGGGVLRARRDGATLAGALSIGAKVRIAEEGRLTPGLALSYDRTWLWSGALESGRIVLLGHVVDRDAADASAGLGLNVFTLALSKHPRQWLQVGGGAVVADNHPLFGSGTPVTDPDGARAEPRLPTQLIGYLNVEAQGGRHFRFIAEYLASTGPDTLVLGLRSLILSGRSFGELRAPGWKARLDTAAVLTSRPSEEGGGLVLLPWIGVGFYPR